MAVRCDRHILLILPGSLFMIDCVHRCLAIQSSRGPARARGLALCLILVLTSTALAQPSDSRSDIDSAGLVIEATLGWDGIVDQSTPIPVSLLIRNDSERNIAGTLSLSDPLSQNQLSLGTVVISAGSTRRFTSIQAMKNWYGCIATLTHNDKIFWRREIAQTIGRRFDQNANYVMFVDNGGRRLSLPGALQDTDPATIDDIEVAGAKGRPFRCLKAKPWQLPNHPGPLCVIQAIVFSEDTVERDLNQVQWKSLAEWTCQGGTVFVHEKSREIVDRIVQQAPLQIEPAIQSGAFAVRRVGLGAVFQYSAPLFSSDSDPIKQSLADVITNLKRNAINSFADMGNFRVAPERRANKNRILVAIFFSVYSLLTGIVLLFHFRLNQKQIAAYTVIVVVGASIFSVLLGGYLRFSPGALNWTTLTQAGTGGLVQVAAIDVQSTGSRNTRVAVKGKSPDLQWIQHDPFWQYREPRSFGYSPFTWQGNLAVESADLYQINVPMTLWGHRRCHATAFRRESQPLVFELDYETPDSPGNVDPAKDGTRIAGQLSLKLQNRLQFDLHDCWLMVGITRSSTPELLGQLAAQRHLSQRHLMRYRPGSQAPAMPHDESLIDLYSMHTFADLKADETREHRFQANFQVAQQNGLPQASSASGFHLSPRISRLGTASAWIIGRCTQSPIMEIDEMHSDFIPETQDHFFIQEILPEEMPAGLQFRHPGK